MSELNKGEIGQIIRVSFGSDISSALSIKMILQPEAGIKKEFAATVGTSTITVDNVEYEADKYAEYTTISTDDLDYVGRWRKKLEVTFTAQNIEQNNYEKFRVLA